MKFKNYLKQNAKVINLYKIIKSPGKFWKSYICVGFIAKQINKHFQAVVFGGNCDFFYQLLPYLDKNVKCIDIVHAFGGGFEMKSLPFIERLDNRVVINPRTYNDFLKQYKTNKIRSSYTKKIILIENYTFIPEKFPRKPDNEKLRILYVGRGSKEKRIHLIGKIASQCHEQNIPAEFVFIGNVANYLEAIDKKYCKILREIKDAKIVKEEYTKSDILILTSEREGFPLVIMEAMAYAVVPIVTDVGGISFYVKNRQNGIIIREKAEHKIIAFVVNVIKELHNNRDFLKMLSRQTYQHCKINFSEKKFVKLYNDLFSLPLPLNTHNKKEVKCSQQEALLYFKQAIDYFKIRQFKKAEKLMYLYRSNINYNLFEKTDNRKLKQPLVSVIIVAYKINQLLLDCLYSLFYQTEKKFEIIVVDNGGNVSIQEKIKTLNILYINNPQNLILSEGRNIGVHFSKGEIVAFLDDDALASDNYISSIIEAFTTYKIIALRGKVLPKTKNINNVSISHYNLGDLPIPAIINTEGNSAFKKSIFLEMNGMNPLLFGHERMELSFRITRKYGRFVLIYNPETIVFHDYASGEDKLKTKSERSALMDSYIRKQFSRVRKYRKQMEKFLHDDCSKKKGYDLINKNLFHEEQHI